MQKKPVIRLYSCCRSTLTLLLTLLATIPLIYFIAPDETHQPPQPLFPLYASNPNLTHHLTHIHHLLLHKDTHAINLHCGEGGLLQWENLQDFSNYLAFSLAEAGNSTVTQRIRLPESKLKKGRKDTQTPEAQKLLEDSYRLGRFGQVGVVKSKLNKAASNIIRRIKIDQSEAKSPDLLEQLRATVVRTVLEGKIWIITLDPTNLDSHSPELLRKQIQTISKDRPADKFIVVSPKPADAGNQRMKQLSIRIDEEVIVALREDIEQTVKTALNAKDNPHPASTLLCRTNGSLLQLNSFLKQCEGGDCLALMDSISKKRLKQLEKTKQAEGITQMLKELCEKGSRFSEEEWALYSSVLGVRTDRERGEEVLKKYYELVYGESCKNSKVCNVEWIYASQKKEEAKKGKLKKDEKKEQKKEEKKEEAEGKETKATAKSAEEPAVVKPVKVQPPKSEAKPTKEEPKPVEAQLDKPKEAEKIEPPTTDQVKAEPETPKPKPAKGQSKSKPLKPSKTTKAKAEKSDKIAKADKTEKAPKENEQKEQKETKQVKGAKETKEVKPAKQSKQAKKGKEHKQVKKTNDERSEKQVNDVKEPASDAKPKEKTKLKPKKPTLPEKVQPKMIEKPKKEDANANEKKNEKIQKAQKPSKPQKAKPEKAIKTDKSEKSEKKTKDNGKPAEQKKVKPKKNQQQKKSEEVKPQISAEVEEDKVFDAEIPDKVELPSTTTETTGSQDQEVSAEDTPTKEEDNEEIDGTEQASNTAASVTQEAVQQEPASKQESEQEEIEAAAIVEDIRQTEPAPQDQKANQDNSSKGEDTPDQTPESAEEQKEPEEAQPQTDAQPEQAEATNQEEPQAEEPNVEELQQTDSTPSTTSDTQTDSTQTAPTETTESQNQVTPEPTLTD